jgi:hypothetical protein
MTLIQRQSTALQAMHEPRTSDKRAHKHRRTVVRAYIADALLRGYTVAEAGQQAVDLWDMYKLETMVEE